MANDTFTGGFSAGDILYEDNHLIAVNKRAGQLVQSDTAGEPGLEEMIKAFIKERDGKPGEVFLGVAHRIDRPVSGAVLFAKTSKALVRLNEMLRDRSVKKIYWAITENIPEEPEGTLHHWMTRDGKTNRHTPTPRLAATPKRPCSATGSWAAARTTGCWRSNSSPEGTTRFAASLQKPGVR